MSPRDDRVVHKTRYSRRRVASIVHTLSTPRTRGSIDRALLAAAASRLLKQIDSDQGLVTVSWETGTHKMMMMNSTVIGAEYIDALRAGRAFSAWLMQALWFMVSQTGARPASALCVGLGAGTVPSFLISKGVDVDVVEHSRAVLQGGRVALPVRRDGPSTTRAHRRRA